MSKLGSLLGYMYGRVFFFFLLSLERGALCGLILVSWSLLGADRVEAARSFRICFGSRHCSPIGPFLPLCSVGLSILALGEHGQRGLGLVSSVQTGMCFRYRSEWTVLLERVRR